MHLFLRDLIKDTLWFITMESQRKDRRRKKPSARRDSNPRPHDHKSRGKCSTAALQSQPEQLGKVAPIVVTSSPNVAELSEN